MKKIIYGLLFLLTCGLTLSACSDDDDDLVKHSATPEAAAAGTYAGTWSKQQVGGDTTTGEGTLTLSAATDEAGNALAYAVNVAAESTSLMLSKSSIANITWVNDGFAFNNNAQGNGFGTVFAGNVLGDGTASITFTVSEKSGRKTVNYIYSFTGKKQ